ncbi:zinc finger MYM-type protein 1-like [Penaeus indicus]|uniref:zinc finger MYM-type protein 1-like n=1 Tax=Penaeus indicus TaxID=29960 RepID=UPI00300D33D7
MSDADIAIPMDLSRYTFDPCCPLPSDRASRNHVIEKGPIRPTQCAFPVNKQGRKILTTWYSNYSWLEYSRSSDKAFCFYCRIFNKQISQKGDPAFINSGFSNWKKTERFSKHEQSECHRYSVESFKAWEKQKSIDHLISEGAAKRESYRQERVKKNCTIIGKLFDITRLLGKLNLAFRGHRDVDSANRGIFKEFVEFVSQTDPILNKHLLSAPENAKYLSPEIQNQYIAMIGSAIRKETIKRVKEAGAYSIIADETPDNSKKEQLALVVRCVYQGVVEERLLAVKTVDETDAKTLLKTIMDELNECEIPIAMLRGQCYDGASNVSGIHAGLQAHSIKAIYHTIESVIATLKEIIEKEKKPNIYAEAKGLLRNIDFEFIFALEVLKAILFVSKGVSDKLQTEDLDVVTGCERVADLNSAITELRNDAKFELFWQEATRKCKRLDTDGPKEERIRKLPRRYEENPSTAVHLDPKANLRVKFYYNGLFYLGPERLDSPEALKKIQVAVDWYKGDLDTDSLEGQLASLQKSQILKRVISPARARKEKKTATFVELYDEIKDDLSCFGEVKKLMEIALSLPLTSCSAERAFSKLKIIKNRLRSTMGQERLQSLMLMSVESDFLKNLDIEMLVKDFADFAPRRMDLV